MADNIFSRLHKWASRQDENYLTESLALVLSCLIEREPQIGLRLINMLTDGFLDLPPDAASTLEIRTQVETLHGRPDLEICCPESLVVFEVKSEAELRPGQLEGYRRYLDAQHFSRKSLVLLTRYKPQIDLASARPDAIIRWYEVGDAFEGELASDSIQDDVCRFLCEQFLAFLEERNMTIAQVNWQMTEGTRALRSFMSMIEEAAAASQLAPKPSNSHSLDYLGFKIAGGKYWVGLYTADPTRLWFETLCPIDTTLAEKLSEGAISPQEYADGGASWGRSAQLESEEVHFFARSKVAQMKWLESFLNDSLALARRIESPESATASALD